MLQEFRDFAMRGNVVDLAVGVIIGAAFGKIVAVLVDNVIMPPIGMVIGGIDFSKLTLTLKQAVLNVDGTVAAPAVEIGYGAFVNTIIQFVIIAWVLFLIVKGMNALKKAEEAAPAAPSEEILLLREIRDSLKK
jgi:large conductance mechanosensitive channel